jgi:hypothetical protein
VAVEPAHDDPIDRTADQIHIDSIARRSTA